MRKSYLYVILNSTRGPDRPRSKKAHNIWSGAGSRASYVEEKAEREKGTSFRQASMEEKVEESFIDSVPRMGSRQLEWHGWGSPRTLRWTHHSFVKRSCLGFTCLALGWETKDVGHQHENKTARIFFIAYFLNLITQYCRKKWKFKKVKFILATKHLEKWCKCCTNNSWWHQMVQLYLNFIYRLIKSLKTSLWVPCSVWVLFITIYKSSL